MHLINGYIFDPDRLIFYKENSSIELAGIISRSIEKTDNYVQLKAVLDSYDKDMMSVAQNNIELIGVCLTYDCQLRCNYCSYSSGERNYNLLTCEDVVAFVVEAIKKRKIYQMAKHQENKEMHFFFSGGGEPTFDWFLFERVVSSIEEKCKQYSVPFDMDLTTNGMLNSTQRAFIIKHFNKVMVSYDGMPSLQNKNRKTANSNTTADIVEKTIREFVDSKLFVTVRSTVWSDDFEKLEDICENIMDKFPNLNEWSVMPILPAGRALNSLCSENYNVDNNFFFYYLKLKKYVEKKQKTLYVSSPVFLNTTVEYCCGASFSECLWIMPDRKITNCLEAEQFRYNVGEIADGKVLFYTSYTDNFLDIVRDKFSLCRDCIAYRFCKGGCPVKYIRDKEFGTKYKEYECEMVKQYWQYVLCQVLKGEKCFGWRAVPAEDKILAEYGVLRLINES